MKINPKALEQALAAIKPAVATRSAVEALSAVKITADANGAYAEATDVEISVEKRLPALELPAQPMEVLIAFADLHKAAKLYGKRPEVELTADLSDTLDERAARIREDQDRPPAWPRPFEHRTRAQKVLAYIAECEQIQPTYDLTISDGKRTMTFPGKRMEDFPTIDWNPAGESQWLDANGKAFADLLARTEPIASKDETRPILTGVCLDFRKQEDPVLTATDSYRLVARSMRGNRGFSIPVDGGVGSAMNIPARMLRMASKSIAKSERVTLSHAPPVSYRPAGEEIVPESKPEIVNGRVLLDIPEAGEIWSARLIEGQYPNWRQLVPDGAEVTVFLPKIGLAEAANIATAMLTKNCPARLCVNGNVKLSGAMPDGPSFEEIIDDAHYRGPEAVIPMEIGFNPEFLRDVAKTTGADTLELDLISPLRPGTFREGDDIHLLMPIRLNV